MNIYIGLAAARGGSQASATRGGRSPPSRPPSSSLINHAKRLGPHRRDGRHTARPGLPQLRGGAERQNPPRGPGKTPRRTAPRRPARRMRRSGARRQTGPPRTAPHQPPPAGPGRIAVRARGERGLGPGPSSRPGRTRSGAERPHGGPRPASTRLRCALRSPPAAEGKSGHRSKETRRKRKRKKEKQNRP